MNVERESGRYEDRERRERERERKLQMKSKKKWLKKQESREGREKKRWTERGKRRVEGNTFEASKE